LWALWGPGSADERLAAATEVLQLADAAGDPVLALESRQWRLSSFLELGDIPAVDAEIVAHARLAAELRQPLYLWMSATWKAMRALLEGGFEEAERLAGEALAIGQGVKTGLPAEAWGGQITIVRREQGRLDEIVPWVQQMLDENPGFLAARGGLAALYAELGREADARREFEQVAAHDFADLPRDMYWLIGVVHLAEACAFLDDARRAALVYDLLLPYGWQNVVLGPGVASLGSAARHLGLLATTMGRWAEAEAHFEAALAFNTRMGAYPWMAHTCRQYAAMLVRRGAEGDRARAAGLLDAALETGQKLGMAKLIERATALERQLRGARSRTDSSVERVAAVVQSERPDLRGYAAPDGTVTVMFTDIENFTVLVETLGDRDAHEIARAHDARVRECVAGAGGVEVKAQGDGFMIVFRSPRGALRCAIAIERAISSWSVRHPGAPIRVRIGIHAGEVIREADDFFGKAVVLAARIAGRASGGQILVSAAVREAALGRAEFAFDGGREVELKGLAGTYTVYELAW
jgi:class 3 adenylate cyclase